MAFIRNAYLNEEGNAPDGDAYQKPDDKVGGKMPAYGESRVTQSHRQKQQSNACDGQIRQKTGGDDAGTSEMSAGAGISLTRLFFQRRDARALVRTGAGNAHSKDGHQKKEKDGGEKDSRQILWGKRVDQYAVYPQKEIRRNEGKGRVGVIRQN